MYFLVAVVVVASFTSAVCVCLCALHTLTNHKNSEYGFHAKLCVCVCVYSVMMDCSIVGGLFNF